MWRRTVTGSRTCSPNQRSLSLRVLVTGAAGFIGSHLCRELWDNGHDVRGLDNHVTDAVPYNQPVEKLLPWGHGAATYLDDALEIEKRLDAERAIGWEPDVVIHLAAKVGRLFGEDDVYRTAQEIGRAH